MDHGSPQHEKIRFRRDEITDLGRFPSACDVPPLGRAVLRRRKARLVLRVGAWLAACCAALVVLTVGAIYAFDASGVGSARLRGEAERAIEKMAGVDVKVDTGPAGITLDRGSFLALQVRDVVVRAADGALMARAGSVRFGVRLLPLMSGQVRLASATVSDAQVYVDALPKGEADWAASLRNADGLIDPDRVIAAVFASVSDALDLVRADSVHELALSNVTYVMPAGSEIGQAVVAYARVSQSGPGRAQLSSEGNLDGRKVSIEATVSRDAATRRIAALDADIDLEGDKAPAPESVAAGDGAGFGSFGKASIHVTGSEGGVGGTPSLTATASLDGLAFDLGKDGVWQADLTLDASARAGTGKVSFPKLVLKSGRSAFEFAGSVGPKRREASSNEEPSYGYEFVSGRSLVSPDDSPEPALPFIARMAGSYQTVSNRLVADTLAVKSSQSGEVLGNVALQFSPGQTPGLTLAVNVHDMAVSHVKQLWPWFSASGARRWVLDNLFGGRVVDASLRYQVPPGHIGSGVPPTADQAFGRFKVADARFDTAGRIPPVRDAIGTVEFHGPDVDISLDSGTVYMPSGRTVAASNGTLSARQVDRPPVVGKLDIDVAGDAAAIAELASYEPINAMGHVGLTPDDFTAGTVTGNVKADIPFEPGVDKSTLGWQVSLVYKDLSLGKPVDGQLVTGADGTIAVDPSRAVISAKAALNGIPAEIDVTEPLGSGGPPASRKVALVLDDKIRQAMMPGLSALLSGPVKVALDRNEDGSQKVSADLTQARLTVPWVGWSKGAGIPAKAEFDLTGSGRSIALSDFDLEGDTFSVQGDVALSGGRLASADFDNVQLNRGDSVSVSIDRNGGGYAVGVKGDSLDARSLVKQFTSGVETATRAAGKESVSVKADVKTLLGFHDERMSNVHLEYSGAGTKVNGLEISATASSGAAVSVTNSSGSGRHLLGVTSSDAGAILRFLDIYEHMQGGAITVALAGDIDGPLRGTVDARNFLLVNEPRLASLVSTPPAGGTRSLNQAVKADIDTSRAKFDRAYAEVDKGAGYLRVSKGVLRGTSIGTTFQGTLYDQSGNMDMTGTFMPIYGLNRIFGELPLVGALLGNGRDRGLIGVTYKLSGNARRPILQINPLSVIAPGIFRSIFEFH